MIDWLCDCGEHCHTARLAVEAQRDQLRARVERLEKALKLISDIKFGAILIATPSQLQKIAEEALRDGEAKVLG